MPARPPRPNGSCSTRASPTRSAKSTRAPRSWTGWSRSRSAASRSRPPRRPASGASTGSTSSTRRATSTSRPKSSARCASSTARSPCSTPSPASSRSRRPSGARPTSTACRASASSTRWTASARTSSARSSRSPRKLGGNPVAIQLPIGSEDKFVGVVDLVRMKSITYKDETMGADYIVGDIPADMLEDAKHFREQLIEKVSEADDKILEKYLHGEEITEDEIKAALRKRVNTSVHTDGRQGGAGVRAGHLRLGVQEQGRAAAARRDRRLPAVARSTCRRSRASTRTRGRTRSSSVRRRTTRRSRRSASRS